MGEIVDLVDKTKKYYAFTPAELRGFVISILIIAFVISFKEWGKGADVELGYGLFSFFNAALIVALSMLAHYSVQKIISLHAGFRVEYQMWTIGLLIALIFAFASNGSIWFIIPGGILFHHLAGHRLGWFRYDVNYFAVGILSLWGVVASIGLAIFFKIVENFIATPLITKAIAFNLAYAVYSILPIPPADGNRIFFGSRMLYAFSLVSVVSVAVLLLADVNIWVAVIGSLAIGAICWLLYYVIWEKGQLHGSYGRMK